MIIIRQYREYGKQKNRDDNKEAEGADNSDGRDLHNVFLGRKKTCITVIFADL
jgi:hypothetical protein